MKKKINVDTINIIIIIIMVFVLGIALGYWLNQTGLTECESNPLVYAAQKYEKETGYEFFGYGMFNTLSSPNVVFNSSDVTFSNLKI